LIVVLGIFRTINYNIFIAGLIYNNFTPYDLYHKLLQGIYFLYHALLMHLTFVGVEGLELLFSIVISLEHPAVFRQNVTNKHHSNNLFI
jgi:hypothetical protein